MSEKRIAGVGRSPQTVASFLQKTFQILENHSYKNIITWDDDGVGFVIKNVVSFTKEILPQYFRHCNLSSFVRQLNMYDFHKVKQDKMSLVFKNPFFTRNSFHKLAQIKRKAARKTAQRHQSNANSTSHPENEKYSQLIRDFRRDIDIQINSSYCFLERSLEHLREYSQSNILKKISLNEMADECKQKTLNDSLFRVKELCYKTFNQTENWLTDYIESMKKKQRVLMEFSSQTNKISSKSEIQGEVFRSNQGITDEEHIRTDNSLGICKEESERIESKVPQIGSSLKRSLPSKSR